MKRILALPILLGLAVIAAACGTAPATTVIPAGASTTQQESGPMSMGMRGNMMARHHARIPTEYAGLTNPVAADEESLARGREIYATYCTTCHGDGGMGDGPTAESLDPAPAAIAHTSQMLGDDYLFWRISEGGAIEPFNSSMIAWKAILNEDSRWDAINYVQALGKGTVMPSGQIGGASFDPQVEAAKQAEMLTQAVEQGVITDTEAAVFATVHKQVDDRMIQMRNEGAVGSMDELTASILAELVASANLTQEHADTFQSVHNRLGAAGLMQ